MVVDIGSGLLTPHPLLPAESAAATAPPRPAMHRGGDTGPAEDDDTLRVAALAPSAHVSPNE